MRHPNSHYLETIPSAYSLDERLAPIVAHLLPASPASAGACYIDLCARDFTMLRALSGRCAGSAFVGIDRNPENDPRKLWDIELSTKIDDAAAIPFPIEAPSAPARDDHAAWGHALIMDVFADAEAFSHIDRLARRAARKVYCRPPANVPQTRFTDSVEGARRLACKALGLTTVDFFAAEWYYAAACVKAMGRGGRAVLHIPARLLNLGKCEADRKTFIEAGLIEQVVQLPEPLSQGEGMDNDALLILSYGNHESIDLIDARGCSSGESSAEAVLALLRERDHMSEDGTDAPWIKRLDIASLPRTSWSLAPFASAGGAGNDESADATATIGECFVVERGVPRSTITKLPDVEASSEPVSPADYYYLTGRVLNDGSRVPFDSLRQAIDASDVFDLGDLYAREIAGEPMGLKRLKIIDPFAPHVVITRIGMPYKVAMLEPGHSEWDDMVDGTWSHWLQDSVVLPDGMICLTPITRDGDAAGRQNAATGDGRAGATADNPYACLPEYLLAYLSTEEGQDLLRATAHGTVPQLSVGDIRKMRIPLPPLEEQRAIAERFAARQLRYEQAAEHLAQTLKEKRAPLL